MTGPVSNSGNNAQQIYHQMQGSQISSSSIQGGNQVTGPKPGNGVARVNHRQVLMRAMNDSGFVSAFSTINSARITELARMGINPRNAQTIMSARQQLSDIARRDMQAIAHLELNNFPSVNHSVQELSRNYASRLTPAQKTAITEAISNYQGTYGDNFLMNISVMGYKSLEHYLQSRDSQFHDPSKVDDFVLDFAERYAALSDDIDDLQDELNALKNRLKERLTESTHSLRDFIHAAPRISSVPLLKGATGGNNPVTTQLAGSKALDAILHGQALNFNGFLSTTSNYGIALDFARTDKQLGLGNPMYTIDLNANNVQSEVLRRAMLQDLERGSVDTNSFVFYLKTHQVAGISLNGVEDTASIISLDFPNPQSKEDEILLAPGHYFEPEQVIRNESGIAVIGNLKYGLD
ncbi:hypothetical protein [Serratia ficaria]|uniref:hypothetical protein n=1 Tax=Serratia ficaria TaxID=61651 RepID=UPI000A3D8D59|nr:hypothetical protein [Serratia ficaria]